MTDNTDTGSITPKSPTKETHMTENRPLTFGEKAVGMTFNPSADPTVQSIKQKFAEVIDLIDTMRKTPECTPEVARMASIAITDAQTAQMWAVKAATWKFN